MKKKSITFCLLSIILGISMVSCTNGTDESNEQKTIEYGLYPKTYVADASIIDKLNELPSSDCDLRGFFQLDNNYYYPFVAEPYDKERIFDDGTLVVKDTKYWFLCEPIEWNVLYKEKGKMLITTTKLIDAHNYNNYWDGPNENRHYVNDYNDSKIREWLNNDFYKMAFPENNKIATTKLENYTNTFYQSEERKYTESTEDKVFILNTDELSNSKYGFISEKNKRDELRACKVTDFAIARGAYYYAVSPYRYGYYCTRSPYYGKAYYINIVDGDGLMGEGKNATSDNFGVRPCINITVD